MIPSLLLLWSLSNARPAEAAEIQWGAVAAGGFSSTLRVPGRVIPKEGSLSIESSRIQGRVINILKREGEIVQEGDTLYAINSPECVSLAQEKQVAEKRGLQDLIDAAKNREEMLGISVEERRCLIRATHGGTLMKRHVELGASFNPGDPLATILDIGNLGIELDVPERNLGQVRDGQVVRVRLAAAPERELRTRVAHVLPTIDPTTRTGKVRLSPVALPVGTTLDALVFADVDTGAKQQAFRVPTTAVVFRRSRQYVIKKDDRRAQPVAVDVLGEHENYSTVIPSDRATLRVGDQVAVKGAIFLLNELNEG